MRYNKYSEALKEKYGEKIYKIPVNINCTCPNRDGKRGYGGCIFCGEKGAGFEAHDSDVSIETQLELNISLISKKYKANKYIVYFQNYTNTYIPLEQFVENLKRAVRPDIVGISISTRPDSIPDEYLEALMDVKRAYGLDIEVELGLQSINPNTLKRINRGHGLAEFIDAVQRIHKYGFSVCAHLIVNMPWDTTEDVVEAARVLSVLEVESVKLHSLYILKETALGELYNSNQIEMISYEEYLDRIILFLRNASDKMIIQRLFGRAPKEDTLFCNWGMSWRKLQNIFEEIIEKNDFRQGDLYNINN